MNDLKENLIKKIKCGELSMRPRWHFVAFSIFSVIGMVLLAVWLVYLESFIIFVLRGTGVVYVPLFGLKGTLVFLWSMPWLLILGTVAFILLLNNFMHRYAFCYQKPLLYSIAGLIGFSMLAALILAKSELHYEAMERAKESTLPLIGAVYRQYGLHPHKEVHIGTVSSSTGFGFIIESRTGGDYVVEINEQTRVPRERIELGDTVLIMGRDKAGSIEAHGIRIFYDRQIDHRPHRVKGVQAPPVRH